MKFGFKQYFNPTPKKLRVLGDTLVALGTAAGSWTIVEGNPQAGTLIVILSVVGKFLSNFFGEDKGENIV
jgi:hypothetical protein